MPNTQYNVTLGELKERIEELESMYGEEVLELPVYASSDYGDHGHTKQITCLSDIEVHRPVSSCHSTSGMSISEDTELMEIPKPSKDSIQDLAVVLTGS